MSKEKEQIKLIPKLRFPEFMDSGEWEEILLENITNGESSNLAFNKLKFEKDGYPVYGADSIVGYIDTYQQENQYISIVKDGSGVGRLNLCKEKSSILGTLYFIKSKNNDKYNLIWIYYALNRIDFSSFIKGAGIPHIYYKDIKKKKILVPIPKEQQKIADFLSNLDELTEAHKQKLALLKQHKKGLMQNLFPIENGELKMENEKNNSQFSTINSQLNKPKYRFPEFRDSGEWMEKKLGEVGVFIGGGTPSTKITEYWNGDIQWYTPTEIKNGTLKPSIRTITRKGLENSSAKLLPKGTILITTRATIGDVAITNKECATNQGFQSLIVKKNESNLFWYYWIIYNKQKLERKASGSTFKEIGKNEIKSIETISPFFSEQQKIAFCLSSIDELITAEAEKIEQLEKHKKGLMQGLFPNVNE